jgi:carbonic anhydrase/SulP family sulfate permease
VLLDAQNNDYLDPDVLELIREFTEQTAPARGVGVSLLGFRKKYQLEDRVEYVDYPTHELQRRLTPQQVLQLLREGHERVRNGRRLTRDFGRAVNATAAGQHPLAAILSCIDSRTPAELIFDLGVGDVFNVRIAGNVLSRKVLGSIEYACAVAGAKLVLVMGHTRCGAATTAFAQACEPGSVSLGDCHHVDFLLREIQESIDDGLRRLGRNCLVEERGALVDAVARANVLRTVEELRRRSPALQALERDGRIAIVGAMYDVAGGDLVFLDADLEEAPTEPESLDAAPQDV